MPQAIDYSWSRPDPDLIASNGYVGVLRYLAPRPNGKVIDLAEQNALHARGLAVGYVWETTAGRALEGAEAGAHDARLANAMADELGVPATLALHYAVDSDVPGWSAVAPYFEGVHSASVRPVRPYGEYDVIEGFHATYGEPGWQTAGWSGSGAGSGGSMQGRRLSAHAALFQLVGYVLSQSSDANEVLGDGWGWHPGDNPAPPPQENPDVSLLVDDPDSTAIWELDGLQRRHVNDPDEVNMLVFLGAKHLDGTADPDARRRLLKARTPIVAGDDPEVIAAAVLASLGHDLGREVAVELAKRLQA